MTSIAIVGSGISGLSAAWALRNKADVTVFEAESRLGGHSYTVDINHGGVDIAVDVGFIVCNPLNYPNFMAFMRTLNVETVLSDMSFAVSDPNGYEWSSNPQGLFADKMNLLRPSFLMLLREILKFNAQAQTDVEAGDVKDDETLGAYLDRKGATERFKTNYIVPMGAAIWSTPEADMLDYPASSFLNFFNNHKLLHRDRPQWRTVKGGSRSYVDALKAILGDRIKTSSPVEHVRRKTEGVTVFVNGQEQEFDHVIMASHSDETYAVLGDGFENQKAILSEIKYTSNRAVLHSDEALMPKRKAAWASWNVLKNNSDRVTLSYWMNKLQPIDPTRPTFVTLNPEQEPAPETVFNEFAFTHPLFDMAAKRGVQHLERVNGRDGLWFSGAWLGHGFHEDGLKSGLRVALALGGEVDWVPHGIHAFPSHDELSSSEPQVRAVS